MFKLCFAGFAVLLLLALVTHGQVPVATAPAEKYQLTVEFHYGGPKMTTDVTIDQPFSMQVKGEKGGFYAISGIVLPPVGESYPVVLTAFEWWSETSNTIGTSKGSYTLGKTISGGSFVSGKSVTLTRVEPK